MAVLGMFKMMNYEILNCSLSTELMQMGFERGGGKSVFLDCICINS